MLYGVRKGTACLNDRASTWLMLIMLQVFMTRRDSLKCIHEPFGDAFYYGPERLSSRFAHDEKGRLESGFQNSTFKTVLDRIENEGAEVRITPPSAVSPAACPFFVAYPCS